MNEKGRFIVTSVSLYRFLQNATTAGLLNDAALYLRVSCSKDGRLIVAEMEAPFTVCECQEFETEISAHKLHKLKQILAHLSEQPTTVIISGDSITLNMVWI